VNHKKRDILFLTITLANLNRFFYYHEKILHATVVKFATSPKLCASVARSLTQNQHNSRLKTAQKLPGKPPEKADNFRHLFRRFSLYVPLVICNSTICFAYLMLLLSFVLCIMHPIVSCQAARATGLLPYAIINSLAVSTDHWFPLKTAVAQ